MDMHNPSMLVLPEHPGIASVDDHLSSLASLSQLPFRGRVRGVVFYYNRNWVTTSKGPDYLLLWMGKSGPTQEVARSWPLE